MLALVVALHLVATPPDDGTVKLPRGAMQAVVTTGGGGTLLVDGEQVPLTAAGQGPPAQMLLWSTPAPLVVQAADDVTWADAHGVFEVPTAGGVDDIYMMTTSGRGLRVAPRIVDPSPCVPLDVAIGGESLVVSVAGVPITTTSCALGVNGPFEESLASAWKAARAATKICPTARVRPTASTTWAAVKKVVGALRRARATVSISTNPIEAERVTSLCVDAVALPQLLARPDVKAPKEIPVPALLAPRPEPRTRTREQISAAMKAGAPGLERCYEVRLTKGPVSEKLQATFQVTGEGGVQAVKVEGAKDAAFGACVHEVIALMRLPYADGMDVDVAWPLIFEPKP